jgi:hypothetical protein
MRNWLLKGSTLILQQYLIGLCASQKSHAMAICQKLPDYLVLLAVIIDDASIPYSAKLNNFGMVMSCVLTLED